METRELHKAVCADCGNECEVPFKPDTTRPVYCRECFGKRTPRSYETKRSTPAKQDSGRKIRYWVN